MHEVEDGDDQLIVGRVASHPEESFESFDKSSGHFGMYVSDLRRTLNGAMYHSTRSSPAV